MRQTNADFKTTLPGRKTLPSCKNPTFLYQGPSADMFISVKRDKKKKNQVTSLQKNKICLQTTEKASQLSRRMKTIYSEQHTTVLSSDDGVCAVWHP